MDQLATQLNTLAGVLAALASLIFLALRLQRMLQTIG
jgi:hypothetical protein